MNIKTLEYIHKLLIEEDSKTNEVYRAARSLQHEYEEHNADKALIASQEKAADEFMNIHFAASNALEDFENQEW